MIPESIKKKQNKWFNFYTISKYIASILHYRYDYRLDEGNFYDKNWKIVLKNEKIFFSVSVVEYLTLEILFQMFCYVAV